MKFLNDKFQADTTLIEHKFEGVDDLAKRAGLVQVKFPDQTKYVIIALAPDGEWLPPNAGLEKFMKFTVKQCIDVIDDAVAKRIPASTYTDLIKNYFGLGDKNVK